MNRLSFRWPNVQYHAMLGLWALIFAFDASAGNWKAAFNAAAVMWFAAMINWERPR